MPEDEPITEPEHAAVTLESLADDVEALKEANESTIEAVQELVDGDMAGAEDAVLDAIGSLADVDA